MLSEVSRNESRYLCEQDDGSKIGSGPERPMAMVAPPYEAATRVDGIPEKPGDPFVQETPLGLINQRHRCVVNLRYVSTLKQSSV